MPHRVQLVQLAAAASALCLVFSQPHWLSPCCCFIGPLAFAAAALCLVSSQLHRPSIGLHCNTNSHPNATLSLCCCLIIPKAQASPTINHR
ncbi:hypothetical protein ACQKWADRAFT_71418 [Trichoderma austrokoningii]